MNIFQYLILPLFIILAFIKSVDFIYLFQIKEYRFDRFFSFLNEETLASVFYARMPRFPAKSIRNILLLIISLIFILIFPASLFSTPISVLLLFVFIPLIAFCITAIGVWLTSFLASVQRNSIIDKAADKIKHSNVTVIGVTGSYGKSSVKEFLYQILSAKFKAAKTDENMNTDVGVALSILKNLQPDTEYFVAEMGAYRIGEIKRICDVVHPKFGVLTAIGNQHISLFGSKENIKKAKTELLEALPQDGKAYVNAAIEDHDLVLRKTKCALTWYSADKQSDIYADAIRFSDDGLTAEIHYKEHTFTIQTKLIGRHNIENLLPAIGVGIELGIPTEKIQKAITEQENLDFKLSMSNGINNATILNDAKNSNVEGFIEAIKTAKQFPHQKKYIISKGIIELGTEKGESYERIISALNDVGMMLVTTDSLFKKIHPEENIVVMNNESEILNYIQENTNKDTLIIIEGKFTKGFVQALVIPSDNEGSH